MPDDVPKIARITLAIGGLFGVLAAAPPSKMIDGVQYSQQETISGIWFTNFENSRFLECDGGACADASNTPSASIHGAPDVIEALDSQARVLTHIDKKIAPTGSFAIRFTGRRSAKSHEPRFLGDGSRDILIERVLDVQLVK